MPLTNLINNISKYYQFNEEEMLAITSMVKTKKFKKKALIVTQGETVGIVAYVNNGLCKSYFTDHKSMQHNILLMQENEWICNGLIGNTGTISNHSIEALEETEIKYFEMNQLEILFHRIPKFESHFRNILQGKVGQLMQDRYQLISNNAEDRYKQFLQNYPDLVQRISQKDIASYLGIFPESLSRIRRQLSKK